MKIFKASDIKEIDEYTILNEPITSVDLIERAASALTCEIISRWLPNKRIVVFAGPGNNGADALAVSRMLIEQGYKLEIFLFKVGPKPLSEECEISKNRLLELPDVDFTEVTNNFSPPYLSKDDLVIDGLFGAGLKEPLQGGFVALVRFINESDAFIVSIDIPSGLFCEWNLKNQRNNIIRAGLTLTFQFPRLAFFFAENEEYLGEWKVLDIELSREAIRKTRTNYHLIEKGEAKRILKVRPKFSNKYNFGSIMVIGGSYGMMGAPLLSAKAAMRAGSGLVTVNAPRCGYNIIQTALPEAIFKADKSELFITDMALKHDYNAVAIGPGLGVRDETINALESFFKQNPKNPCVLDADALNCIAHRPALLNIIPPMSIITPHQLEFDRIFGESLSEEMRLQKAIDIAKRYNLIVVIKGHYSLTIAPDERIYINSTGNSGMSTAGSGDTLTGIIASLMGQGYKPAESAVLGVFIHGYAGDLALRTQGSFGMIASDIIDNVGVAIKEIMA